MMSWSAADPRLHPLLTVARKLGKFREESLFLGGSVLPLLITDPGASASRPTNDVDLSIDITTKAEYYELSRQLRELGFEEDDRPEAPICRWVVDGLTVDIMPTDESVFGFFNRWFRSAMITATLVSFTDGQTLRVISAPYFCATKLEAFRDRGKGDYLASHDMEDIIAVVDGRKELLGELSSADSSVRSHVAAELRSLLGDPDFVDALPGHLPGDAASQARLPFVVARLKELADML